MVLQGMIKGALDLRSTPTPDKYRSCNLSESQSSYRKEENNNAFGIYLTDGCDD